MLPVLNTPICPTLDPKSKFYNKKSVDRRRALGLGGGTDRQINIGLMKLINEKVVEEKNFED